MAGFVLPPKSQVGTLALDVAEEGQKVILSDGDVVNWTPPPPAPVMPDWSQIKSIRKYFNRTGHAAWPAWLYHPTEPARIVTNQHEAADLGVCYREADGNERAKYGLQHVWDWKEDSQWRPTPWVAPKFDPAKPGQGKNYVAAARDPMLAQNEMVATVVASVLAAMKQGGTAPTAPAAVDSGQWDAFLKFQAWQKAQEVVAEVAGPDGAPELRQEESATNALAGADEPDERESWLAEAERKGVKVDGRWSTDRIKSEVLKAA